MKKHLRLLFAAVVAAMMFASVQARYERGFRLGWDEIKAGDTIAMEVGTPGSYTDYYLGVNESGSIENIYVGGSYGNAAWIVSNGPTDINGNATYYFTHLATGKYFANTQKNPTVNGVGNFALSGDLDYAVPFSIQNTDSTEYADQYGPIWDENSAVFCFTREDGDFGYICGVGYWGIKTVNFWQYHDTNAWNVYEIMYQHDLQADLQELIDEMTLEGTDYEGGDKPGQYAQAAVDRFNTALETGLVYCMEEHTDAEIQAVMDELIAAKNDLDNHINPIVDGLYYFVNAYTGFKNVQNVEKAWTASSLTQVGWTTFDENDPAQIFRVTPKGDDHFTIQNYENERYVNGSASNAKSQKVLFSEVPVNDQIIKSIGSQAWIVYNSFCDIAYHPETHNEGEGVRGDLVTWNENNINGKSTWFVRMVSDEVASSLEAVKAQKELCAQLTELVAEANEMWDASRVFTVSEQGLITNANDEDENCQVSSNAKEPSEGSYAALIDGLQDTYFHSAYTADANPKTVPHNLMFDISSTPIQNFVAKMSQRITYYGETDRPILLRFYASNNPDEDGWTFAREIDITNYWVVGDNYHADATLPTIDLGAPYKHVRMDVVYTKSNRYPSGSQVPIFSLAEYQMYPVVLDEKGSQYCYTPGFKEKADKMFELAQGANVKIANAKVTKADVTDLKEAIASVKALYVDTIEVASLATTLQQYVNTAVMGEGIGETSEEAVGKLQSALDDVRKNGLVAPLKKDAVDAAYEKLIQARDEYLATIKFPEVGKWYFILSATDDINHFNGGNRDDILPAAQAALYADGPNKGDHVRYGLLTEEYTPNYTYNPYAMWRIVEVEGAEGKYALQNMGTGLYSGDASKTAASIFSSETPVAYAIDLLGNASFSLTPEGCESTGNSMALCHTGQHVEANKAEVFGDGSWKFEEIDPEQTELIIISNFDNNLIDVISLPYNLTGISEINEDVHLYGIKKMTQQTDEESGKLITTVELYERDDLEAGESAIIMLGDLEADFEGYEMIIPFPTELTDKPVSQNGVVGVFTGAAMPAGTAFSNGKGFKTSTTGVGIGANTGVIDPATYTGEVEGVETALVLTIEGLNPLPSGKVGDVNGDGAVNGADVVCIYNFIQVADNSGVTRDNADVNGDGDVNGADVVAVYNAIVGKGNTNSKLFTRFLNR